MSKFQVNSHHVPRLLSQDVESLNLLRQPADPALWSGDILAGSLVTGDGLPLALPLPLHPLPLRPGDGAPHHLPRLPRLLRIPLTEQLPPRHIPRPHSLHHCRRGCPGSRRVHQGEASTLGRGGAEERLGLGDRVERVGVECDGGGGGGQIPPEQHPHPPLLGRPPGRGEEQETPLYQIQTVSL